LKVLIIPSWYPNKENPVSGIFFKEQAKALSEFIDVAVLNLNISPKNIFPEEKIEKIGKMTTFTIKKLNVFPKMKLKRLLLKYYTLKSFKKIINIFGTPDIIHAHVTYPAGYMAYILKKKYGIPIVITEHATFFEKIYTKNKKIVQKIFDKTDYYIAVGNNLKKQLQSFGRKQCEVIPNFINFEKFQELETTNTNFKSDKFNYINISLMTEKKGIDILLKALNKIVYNYGYKDVFLHLVGDGPKRNEYEKLAKNLRITNYCKFYGLVSNDEIPSMLSSCNALIISSRIETFGVVGIEAMAAGLPVIATICGGPEDYVKDFNGVLVEKENVDELAKGMLYVKNNYNKYNSKMIKKYAYENFSKEAVTKKLIKIYEKLKL
jgi:glycosyltransferase involved in cell wall biosynthesis